MIPVTAVRVSFTPWVTGIAKPPLDPFAGPLTVHAARAVKDLD
jgi:hypothetical protein